MKNSTYISYEYKLDVLTLFIQGVNKLNKMVMLGTKIVSQW